MQQPFGKQLVAGDAWRWTIHHAGYDASAYTLKYHFRGASQLDVTATASAQDARGFDVATTSATTKDLVAGTYTWQACLYDADDNRTEVGRGTVEILPNIAAVTAAYDGRSWVKVALDNVRKVIQNVATREEKSYQIAGRALSVMAPDELLRLENELSRRYQQELAASGQLGARSNDVQVVFTRPRERHHDNENEGGLW